MILTMTKVNLLTSCPIKVALDISDLFWFDPNSVIHTLSWSRMVIARMLNTACL